jgi:carbon storage regulator CsrA
MLVLSRRKGEKIVFPTIGVQLELLKVQGNTARLGINAPRHVKILRDEITAMAHEPTEAEQAGPTREPLRLSHAMRNRLHTAALALQLLKKQMEVGQAEDAESALQSLLFEFASLEKEAGGSRQAADRERPSPKTLVVEDDRNESALLAGFLRINGFDVSEAADGNQALDYLANHELPDLVLLDMLMPQRNGRDTIDAIRHTAAFRTLKVFAISGTSPAELGVVLGPQGVDRWFQKPVNPEVLLHEITQELASVA